MVWKDEAFEIWSKGWACLFPEGDSSRALLEQVLSIVDRSFYAGNMLKETFRVAQCLQLMSELSSNKFHPHLLKFQ
jgi:hypothetical protein